MTANPFATSPNDNSNDDNSAASPFDASADQGDLGEGFELPPCPVGVLRGHTTELKKFDKGYMLYVMCDDPAYPSKEPHNIWIGHDVGMLKQIAASLGITAEMRLNPDTRRTNVYFSDDDGNKGLKAFAKKPGMFVFAPYNGEASINKFGNPKKGASPEWDQWAEEAELNDEQTKALKRARGGVVPGDSIHLFE